MNQTYFWTKGLFKSDYHVFSGQKEIGKLFNKTFSQTGFGELNGKRYCFQTKGFLHPVTEIIEESSNTKIGSIIYNSWMNKAQIIYSDKKANWWYENILNTQWRISDQEGNQIKYQGSETKGRIDFSLNDDLLLLTGLYITNYYRQMTIAVIIAVFVPIWLTVLN